MPHVLTVLGAVPPEELGCTDAHSHVWIEPVAGAALEVLIHDDETGIIRDLQEFQRAGGQAVVDCQPGGVGRNGCRLRSISQKSGLHIIACTGFHLRRYYPPNAALWSMTPDQAYDYFMTEITSCLSECRGEAQPVFPGFIKIAAEASPADSPMELFRVVAAVSQQTGLAIEMHTERGAAIEDFLDFFLAQGLTTDRLIFCHVDKRPDLKLHQELAEAGVLLEYDTFIRPNYQPQKNAWPLLEGMIEAGYSRQVALATDLAVTNQWTYLGGAPGAVSFVTHIRNELARNAIPNSTIAMLTGGNISRQLALDDHKEN